MKEYTLEELAAKHDYYCSDSNYYSNDAGAEFTTFADFYEEFCDADVDMNLVFRWDLIKRESSDRYYLHVFQISQRKGIFRPILISYFDEKDIPLFVKYIKPHMEKLQNLWRPLDFV